MEKKQVKAVSLISGGLDSMLATKMMLEQGIHVEGINFLLVFVLRDILMQFVSKIKKNKNVIIHYGLLSS